MELRWLLRLAEHGITKFPPSELSTLEAWCWDYSEASGDARYCSLARSISLLSDLFEITSGQVSADLIVNLDGVLREQLPSVLRAANPQDGALLARQLREGIGSAIETHDQI